MHHIINAMDAIKGAMLASDVSRINASLLLQDHFQNSERENCAES